MPRLQLKEKESEKSLTIKRKTGNNSNYIPGNDPELFSLLTDNRHEDEIFSRVGSFFVNHYYYIGSERLREVIFYPSSFGIEQINEEKNHPCKNLYKILLDEGKGYMHERPIPIIRKPVKRLSLECKPKRMQLECSD
jgi:hypothetical protein